MSDSLANIRTMVRDRLDESAAKFWTQANLNTWINQGAQNIAKRAEVINDRVTIPVMVNAATYAAPADTCKIHRIEFSPDNGVTLYPLEKRDHQEMDQVWGSRQSTSYAYPNFFVPWGVPPNLKLQLYPVPSSSGSLNIYYYRLPHVVVNDADVVEIPQGWESCLVSYVEYMALRKDADPRWQEAKQLYEEELGAMIDLTHSYSDQSSWMSYGTSILPQWLVGSGGGGWD